MIKPGEIQQIAQKTKVRDTQIEKDYVITWILTGIANNKSLRNCLAFKGGTVLKKFYFNDYRFSEDLDFTLTNSSLSNDNIIEAFNEMFTFVKDEANIPLTLSDFSVHETENINFYVNYIGPLGGTGTNKNIKVDISRNELLKFNLEKHKMFKVYTDQPDCHLSCYSLKEIMTEKLRSLLSRTQPRDFFDLWYLTKTGDMNISDYKSEFYEKSISKGLKPDELQTKLEAKLAIFKSRWSRSMADQIHDLPPFDQVSRELGKEFRKFFK